MTPEQKQQRKSAARDMRLLRARNVYARKKQAKILEAARLAARHKLLAAVRLSDVRRYPVWRAKLAEAVVGNGTVAEVVEGLRTVMDKLLSGAWVGATLAELAAVHSSLRNDVQNVQSAHAHTVDDRMIWTIRYLKNHGQHRAISGCDYTVLSDFGRNLADRYALADLKDVLVCERYPVTLCVVLFAETRGNNRELRMMMKHILFDPVLLFNGTFVSSIAVDAWLYLGRLNYPKTWASCLQVFEIEIVAEYLAGKGRVAEAALAVEACVSYSPFKRAALDKVKMARLGVVIK